MLSLELELIAILVLVAVIGILMGRFLCKSGESDERAKKDKIIHAYKALKSEFEITESKTQEQFVSLKGLEERLAQATQEVENSEARVQSSNTQQKQLLVELKVLEKYKARFESLDREFQLQAKSVEALKSEKINSQKEIADFKITTNRLNKTIADLESKEKEMQGEMQKLHQRLKEQGAKHEKSSLEGEQKLKEMMNIKEKEYENTLQKTHKKYQSKLEAKERKYEKLEEESAFKYKEMVQLKDEAYERLKIKKETLYGKLEQESAKKYKEMLQLKDVAYERLKKQKDMLYGKLEQESSTKYKEMVQRKDEAYEKLERESSQKYKEVVQLKDKTYEEMLASKNKSYEELHIELERVEREYEEFKINYSLDSDRLDSLELDHKKIYHTLETIVSERDDLLSRLRAISSVVSAVGVDGSTDKTQQLLENR